MLGRWSLDCPLCFLIAESLPSIEAEREALENRVSKKEGEYAGEGGV